MNKLDLNGQPPSSPVPRLADEWLSSARANAWRVRIRTLIHPQQGEGRETWLAHSLAPALGIECQGATVCLGQQCHGTHIADADGDEVIAKPGRNEFPGCDGLVTRKAGVVLAVRTADCVPIIVADIARPWLGAVHAGWRGTLGGILARLLHRALDDGSQPGDLRLWIGPHIRACHYEIGTQLSQQFQDAFPERPILAGERHLSLLDANIIQALRAGVDETHIRASPLCTFEERNGLPSYRRDGRSRGEIITTAVIL